MMNLMRGCKSVSYEQKSLIKLIKFIKMAYLLRNANRFFDENDEN